MSMLHVLNFVILISNCFILFQKDHCFRVQIYYWKFAIKITKQAENIFFAEIDVVVCDVVDDLLA
jgi:hypothetical protein